MVHNNVILKASIIPFQSVTAYASIKLQNIPLIISELSHCFNVQVTGRSFRQLNENGYKADCHNAIKALNNRILI